jgi:hypothetical protein
VVAGTIVVLFGLWRLLDRRHPRYLARVRPVRLAWWSLLIATAHGAGLMLVPVAIGLCTATSPWPMQTTGHAMPVSSMQGDLAIALGVAIVHTLAMIGAGVGVAWIVYRYLGLRFLTRGWLNLDAAWGATLVATGALSAFTALAAR